MKDEWEESEEYRLALSAWKKYILDITKQKFIHSQQFANARHAYRRRINNSPSSETT